MRAPISLFCDRPTATFRDLPSVGAGGGSHRVREMTNALPAAPGKSTGRTPAGPEDRWWVPGAVQTSGSGWHCPAGSAVGWERRGHGWYRMRRVRGIPVRLRLMRSKGAG
eukprot:766348-Hanusia_phi.AAC.1